jgi:hypothetical protein
VSTRGREVLGTHDLDDLELPLPARPQVNVRATTKQVAAIAVKPRPAAAKWTRPMANAASMGPVWRKFVTWIQPRSPFASCCA